MATCEPQTAAFHGLRSKVPTADCRLRLSGGGAPASTRQPRISDGEARASKGQWAGCFWAECGSLNPTLRCLMVERRLHAREFGCLSPEPLSQIAAFGSFSQKRAAQTDEFAGPTFERQVH